MKVAIIVAKVSIIRLKVAIKWSGVAIITADLSIIRTKVANIMPSPAAKVLYLKKVANKGCKVANKIKI